MKKIILIFLILTNAILVSHANTYLFEVEKKGVCTDIFGTCHNIPLSSLSKEIVSYVNKHDILITENKDVLVPITQDKLEKMRVLRQPNEDDYFSCLSNDEQEEILKYAEPFMQYKKFPIDINALNPTGLLQTYVGGHMMGMDYELIDNFKKEEKVILGLENLEEVSTYFKEVSLATLQKILEVKYGFGSPEEEEQNQKYLSGDISTEPVDEDETDEVKNRNLNWLPNILDYYEKYGEKAIFCVGYGHLLGKDGLLNLLKEEGFTIKRANDQGIFSPFNH